MLTMGRIRPKVGMTPALPLGLNPRRRITRIQAQGKVVAVVSVAVRVPRGLLVAEKSEWPDGIESGDA